MKTNYEGTPPETMFPFGHWHCPKRGGEAPARIFWPFFLYHVLVHEIGNLIPKTLIFVCYLVIFCHLYDQNYHHNYHCNRHNHNWYFSVIRAKHCFDGRKVVRVSQNGEKEAGGM